MRGDGASVSDRRALDEPAFGRALLRALRNTHISVLYQGTDLRYQWAENAPAGWPITTVVGLRDEDILPSNELQRLSAAKEEVLSSGDQQRLEIRIPDGETLRWFDLWIDADRDEHGAIGGLVTTAVEITDQKLREQTLRALLREVSHRSKNLLAIILSIANQTGRYSEGLSDFLTRFRGRLQSLASSQDLVTSSNWRGADLHELIVGQVMRYCEDPVKSVHLEGGNPYLNPNAALHVGLALHELAVNSVSHGALSRSDGQVTICAWPVDGQEGAIELIWSEKVEVADGPPPTPRFGSLALEKVVPAALNGSATLNLDADSLVYRLIVPSANVELG